MLSWHANRYYYQCHYAYYPCDDAVLSLHELAAREWHHQENKASSAKNLLVSMSWVCC